MRALSVAFGFVLLMLSGVAFAQSVAVSTCDLAGYASAQAPHAKNEFTVVEVGLAVPDLVLNSDLEQNIVLDALLTVSWVDPRLRNVAGCRFALNEIWHPDI